MHSNSSTSTIPDGLRLGELRRLRRRAAGLHPLCTLHPAPCTLTLTLVLTPTPTLTLTLVLTPTSTATSTPTPAVTPTPTPTPTQLASLVSMVEGDEPSMKGLAHKQRKREVGHHSPIAP